MNSCDRLPMARLGATEKRTRQETFPMSTSENTPFDGPGPDAVFRQRLAEGRFFIQRCRDTGRHVFYPRALSPYSGKPNLGWVEASGRGVVYATTVTRRRK